jgi:ubiquinone/menaquinone biosynthesis C-methylase UbiE
VAALCSPASVSSTAKALGKHVPALSSALRPLAEEELRHHGGPALVRGKRVLDLGCGDGRLAIGAAPYAKSVVGLDIEEELIESARRRARDAGLNNVRFVVGAGQKLPFPDGSFDVVISSWTL